MKKCMMIIGTFVVCMGIAGAAKAAWTCNPGGQAKCLVNYVELYTADSSSTHTYVLANITIPPGVDGGGCVSIKVKKGSANASIDTIKMAETILATALTTQLPIKYEIIATDSGGRCIVDNIAIQKPSN
jgi:hypothetical protein